MDSTRHILLIEDDEVDRKSIVRALRGRETAFEVTGVSNATEGYQALTNRDFHCVLLDYRLPDANGLDVLKTMYALKPNTPIIIITSQGDEKVATEAIKSGAADYLPKDRITPDGLVQSIATAMRIGRIEAEKAAAERALRESRERLEAVINNAHLIVFAVDHSGHFTLSAGKGLEQLQMQPGEVVGQNIFKFYKNFPQITDAVTKALGGESFENIVRIEDSYWNTWFQPSLNAHNEVTGAMGIATDMTARIEAEKQLIKAKELAEETARLKQEFLANMSHEIRTPMNAITGFTDLLLESELTPMQEEHLSAIKTSGDNLLVLINDILDFSKLEAGKMAIESIPVQLPSMLRDLKKIYSIQAVEKSLNYTVDWSPDLPPTVLGDPVRLNQVLINLIGNAIKFTPSGTVSVTAKVESQSGQQVRLLFEVADTGIGIPADKLSDIFESFTQVTGSYQRQHGGTGLGLAIVNNLVQLMNGTIGVESVPDQGSVFRLSIPFEIPVEQAAVVIPTDAATQSTAASLKGVRVLLVEDNLLNQKLAAHVLGQLGMVVELAENGKIALKMVSSATYDIILMDIQMPEMDGITAAKHIRNEFKSSIPIIALTAHAMTEEVDRCLAAGMNAHVTKPFRKTQLIEQITKFIH